MVLPSPSWRILHTIISSGFLSFVSDVSNIVLTFLLARGRDTNTRISPSSPCLFLLRKGEYGKLVNSHYVAVSCTTRKNACEAMLDGGVFFYTTMAMLVTESSSGRCGQPFLMTSLEDEQRWNVEFLFHWLPNRRGRDDGKMSERYNPIVFPSCQTRFSVKQLSGSLGFLDAHLRYKSYFH
jgi:hypothetical protein